MKVLRELPFRTSRGRGEGQPKADLLYISYIEQRGKTADKGGGGVSFRPKIVDVLYGRPLKQMIGCFPVFELNN